MSGPCSPASGMPKLNRCCTTTDTEEAHEAERHLPSHLIDVRKVQCLTWPLS